MEIFKKTFKSMLPERSKEILRKIEDFFRRINFGFDCPVILTDINGLRFILYPEQKNHIRWLCKRGEQKNEFSAMKKVLKAGQTAFDVGANIGDISMFLAKYVTEKGKVHSFEPFPESYKRLKENVAVNNFDHVICNKIGLSDKIGQTELFYDTMHPGFNSLGQMKDINPNPSIKIQLSTIDEYCLVHKISHIHILKIDIEGFELDVLKGAQNMLKNKAIDFIQFELSDKFLTRFGKTPKMTLEYLNSVGYDIFNFDENRDDFSGPLTELPTGCFNYYASYENLANK